MLDVKSARKQLALCLVAIGTARCGQPQPPEPSAPVTVAGCSDPAPPPLAVVSRSGDLVACLTEAIKRRGLVVTMDVGRDGHATSVQQWAYLCPSLDAKGQQGPPAALSLEERACVTKTIRSWRFAAFNTCARQFAHIGIPAQGSQLGCAARINEFGINQP